MQQFQYFLSIVFFTIEKLDALDFSFQYSLYFYFIPLTYYLDLTADVFFRSSP